MSNYIDVADLVGTAVQRFQDATDAFDEAAAGKLGINRTDLRCLSIVSRTTQLAASALAAAAGLSRGAATSAIDRLENAGLLRRTPSREDRRSVLISMTLAGMKAVDEIWGRLIEESRSRLSAWDPADLLIVTRFLDEAASFQAEMAAGLGRGREDRSSNASGSR